MTVLLKRWLRRVLWTGGLLGVAGALALGVLWLCFPFPEERLAQWPQSPRVTDRAGNRILARVASDDQWRFPVPLEKVSEHLVHATLAAEDERFHWHPGVDPLAVARAAVQNLRHGRIVSGASTLPMQIARMMGGRPRTFRAKAIEAFRAVQLSARASKNAVLARYLNIAPYGGNLRGAEAAARRYFAKPAADLSLAEAALLAGLPQSPARLNPRRHPDRARKRRNAVLARMREEGYIDEAQRARAAEAPIRLREMEREAYASHAGWLSLRRRPKGGRTTIEPRIQRALRRAVDRQRRRLPEGADVAVAAIEIERTALVGLIGSAEPSDPVDGRVNGATAPRSPGSALKPFVYAAAIDAGRLGRKTTVYDVPIARGGWRPENFDRTFHGELPAGKALRRSLNIPAVLIAEQVGLRRCLGVMAAAGINLPTNTAARGGLAAVTGGTEVTLLELTNAYATLARGGTHRPVRLFADAAAPRAEALPERACRAVNHMLSTRKQRPRGLRDAKPADIPWFTWKTGTSSGRRDAWAIGHNRRYAVGVWAGRFSGDGDVAFVGARAAEPLLAELLTSDPLANHGAPPAPDPITPSHPIEPPDEAQDNRLAIARPDDGATYIAEDGSFTLRPRLRDPKPVTWFLDGERVGRAPLQDGLVLEAGVHRLRCVDRAGRSRAVRIAVTTDSFKDDRIPLTLRRSH